MKVEIEIDGIKVQAEQGSMIIEAADHAGIKIPRFCYHKKLSVAANCRMCLVELEKAPKPMPACATPVSEGIKVFTKSAIALQAQRSVMEFLLINHPLDCPICDQGGECELQDVSMGYGGEISRFSEGKRSVDDEDLGALIATDMTRCIHCTRCVRFGEEIAGLPELGATGRGEKLRIGTYIEKSLTSEMSGNMIDVCPVGALTSKPFRFKARAWELMQRNSIAAHDCVGSNISVHIRGEQVMRVVPRENDLLNEVWISDRDRFSYAGLNSADRLMHPMLKRNGQWQITDWQTALNTVVDGLDKIRNAHGADQIGALISPNATLEEHFITQKFMRGLGSNNIDHRLHIIDFSDQEHIASLPSRDVALSDFHLFDMFCLIGADVNREQPIIGHRIRQSTLDKAQAIALSSINYKYNFNLASQCCVHPNELVKQLLAVVKLLDNNKAIPARISAQLNDVVMTDFAKILADSIQSRKSPLILLGAEALNHPQASMIRSLSQCIALQSGAKVMECSEGANAAGAWFAGTVPHRIAAGASLSASGLNTQQMFANKLKAYLLMGVEPELDCVYPAQAIEALKEAPFVLSISPFKSELLMEYADILLPSAPFTETSGTFINSSGDWQSFSGVVKPYGEARPAWKIFRVLGNLFELDGFQYDASSDIKNELEVLFNTKKTHNVPTIFEPNFSTDSSELIRINTWPLYRNDNLVRRSQPLQDCAAHFPLGIYMNANTAKRYQCLAGSMAHAEQGEGEAILPVIIDEKIADNTLYIPSGYPETRYLENFGPVNLKPYKGGE